MLIFFYRFLDAKAHAMKYGPGSSTPGLLSKVTRSRVKPEHFEHALKWICDESNLQVVHIINICIMMFIWQGFELVQRTHA